MTISVAILTWNRVSKLLEALESVKAQTRSADEIVVVDSASRDNTCTIINRIYPDIKLIRLHRNLGCPMGRNLSLANCSSDVIYSLDDDARLHPKCLEIVEQVFTDHPKVGIVASKVLMEMNPSSVQVAQQLSKSPRRTVRFLGGACAIRREVLEKAGYYPNDFWRQSEEADLALRAIDVGFELWYAPAAIMLHPPGIADSSTALDHTTWNTLRSITRLCPARYVPLILAHQTIKYIVLGVCNHKLKRVGLGIGRWVMSLPRQLRQRHPVRVESMREYLRLRREYFAYLKAHGNAL